MSTPTFYFIIKVLICLFQGNYLKYTNSKKSEVAQQYVCVSSQGKQEAHKHQKISGESEIQIREGRSIKGFLYP